jgi:hypothetical protein
MATVIFNCPCGTRARVMSSYVTNLPRAQRHGYCVQCVNADCRRGLGPHARTEAGAIRLWNKQVGPLLQQQATQR